MTLLSIGDFAFKGTLDRPPRGEYLVTLEGWEDGVEMRRASRSIPQNHGGFDVPAFMEERTVTFTGDVYAESPGELSRRGQRFVSLLAEGDSQEVAIELDGLTLGGFARRGNSKPTWRRVAGVPRARAAMELVFNDPRRYGDFVDLAPAPSGTPFSLYHYGTFPATPKFTILGSMPGGYVLSMANGRQFRVTAPLVGGHPHVIDMAYGSLTIDGVLTAGKVSRADTWAIPKDIHLSHSLAPITTGSATVYPYVRDTFS